MFADSQPHQDSLRAAIGDRLGLVWLTMVYACENCGTEGRVQAEVGVEGPADLQERKLFVPSPYSFRCACDGLVSHVRFYDDNEFEPRDRDPNRPCFVYDGGDCGRLDRVEGPWG